MAPKRDVKTADRSRPKRPTDASEHNDHTRSSYLVFYEAAPEGGYVAVVPALPGCHSQGETLEQVGNNVQEAIEVYLESLISRGEPIPEETRVFQGIVTVSIPLARWSESPVANPPPWRRLV
jgi:predicted RNase H-like HicB family nuclease